MLTQTQDGAVALLTLNRPDARNALSVALMTALEHALAVLGPETRAIVITGAPPAFCAGHDLRELAAHPHDTAPIFAQCSRLMQALVAHPAPVIAAVEGIATAAGCQLVATCDLAIAAEGATFATPGVNLGLFCSTPMVALARAVPPKAAMEMLLLGKPVGAAHAERIGLINAVVPDGQALAAALAWAHTIAAKSPAALRTGKAAFHRSRALPLADAYALAAPLMARDMASADAAEGIAAFRARRPPIWPAPKPE